MRSGPSRFIVAGLYFVCADERTFASGCECIGLNPRGHLLYVWWERRQQVHGEYVQKPAHSALSISTLTANYVKARKNDAGVKNEGWTKPKEGHVKLNVDATFYVQTLKGAVGDVLQDDKGGFIVASNEKLEHVSDATSAEAYAVRHRILLAQQMGVSKLVVEADYLEVINTMNVGGFIVTGAATIYADCNVLSIGYTSVSFAHCPRRQTVSLMS